MQIVDITRTLSRELAPWPGDTAFDFQLNWKMAEGASVNVGKMTMGTHNGTHADAPFHFEARGQSIEQIALETFFGSALVIDLTNDFSKVVKQEIQIAHLAAGEASLREAPRLLLKTGAWPNSNIFPSEIPVIAPDVPGWLQARGVKLLGLDLPSVDPIDSKNLANHHALAAAKIQIVESLDLTQASAGLWHFAALPLKIAGADAAPLRAILWRE